MRTWVAPASMASALVINYTGHRTGWWPTLCTKTRDNLTQGQFIAALSVGVGFLVKHVLDGYPARGEGAIWEVRTTPGR